MLLGEAVDVDAERARSASPTAARPLRLADRRHRRPPHYFGHDDWAPSRPGLKSIEDALEIRRRILIAFEAAEREADPDRRREWLTFVVVGGGPTGVELAGALGEIARDTLRHDFRAIDPATPIILVEAIDRILPTYPPGARRRPGASSSSWASGAHGGPGHGIDDHSVNVLDSKARWRARGGIPARTSFGPRASSRRASRVVAAATGAETDRNGRVLVART